MGLQRIHFNVNIEDKNSLWCSLFLSVNEPSDSSYVVFFGGVEVKVTSLPDGSTENLI